MEFHSWQFLVFLLLVLCLYYALQPLRKQEGGLRAQNLVLLGASYVFYAAFSEVFLLLILASTLVDFLVARAMERRPDRRRLLLLISLGVNLGLLGYFKYRGFFADNAAALLRSLGMEPGWSTLELVLPMGISFYTFQTIAYTYAVYQGRIRACHSLLDFALYVSFFPQLVAGPIERAEHLLPQLQRPRRFSWGRWRRGSWLILQGYFKKLAIGDVAAQYVDAAFASPEGTSGLGLLLAVYMFALQIYGDFSGYTDIARGVGRLFGVDLMLNFRQPYLAGDITTFWRRWHISLSSWLREHLYIPLGGNRHGTLRTYRNLMLTMLLGGLWHGASWNFVIWGGLHGLYLALHKLMLGGRPARQRRGLAALPGMLCTFHLVCLAWVFFRADDLAEAGAVLGGIASWQAGVQPVSAWALVLLGVMFAYDLGSARGDGETPVSNRWPVLLRGAFAGLLLLGIWLAPSSGSVPFLYFQF